MIRADNADPMRKVTFSPSTIEEWGYAHRRVGRPKDQWLYETKKLVWKNADIWKTDRGTQNQTKEPNTRGRRYKKHIFIHGMRTDVSNIRGSRQTGEDKSYRHKRGKAGD